MLRWYKVIGVGVPGFITYIVAGTIAWPYAMCMYVMEDKNFCSLGMIPKDSDSFANNAFCKKDESLNDLGPGRCESHEDCKGSRTCGASGMCEGVANCADDEEEDGTTGKNGQPVGSPAVQWCRSRATVWDGNPWTKFQSVMKDNVACGFKPPKRGDIGSKEGCNYVERATNTCYYNPSYEATNEESFCDCLMKLPGFD